MLGSRSRLAPVLCLVLLPLAGCAPDRQLPLATEDPRRSLVESVVLLESVAPSAAVYSEPVEVTLRAPVPLPPVLGVQIGGVPAAGVTQVDASTLVARFEGGTAERVGSHTVTVQLAGGARAELPHGFHWQHHQDPVVFVHGCPLPRDTRFGVKLGSVTNFITSKYWHAMYTALQGKGYPAPTWNELTDFDKPPFDHAATRPAADNYLNVFVLSEDNRDPWHPEDAPPSTGAGHCGSGLLMAQELNEYVDEVLEKTGAKKVDLVVNSGGGLGARWFLRSDRYKGTSKVRDVVFLAAMNHGTEVGLVPTVYNGVATWWSPNYEAAREGFPAFACKGEGRGGFATSSTRAGSWNGSDLQYLVNGCLRDPGRQGDGSVEIPDDHRNTSKGAGGVAYLSIYNATVDELIEPTTSACLNQKFPGDCSDLDVNVPVHAADSTETPHSAIRMDPEVIALTMCYLQRRSHHRRSPTGNCERERLAAITARPPKP